MRDDKVKQMWMLKIDYSWNDHEEPQYFKTWERAASEMKKLAMEEMINAGDDNGWQVTLYVPEDIGYEEGRRSSVELSYDYQKQYCYYVIEPAIDEREEMKYYDVYFEDDHSRHTGYSVFVMANSEQEAVDLVRDECLYKDIEDLNSLKAVSEISKEDFISDRSGDFAKWASKAEKLAKKDRGAGSLCDTLALFSDGQTIKAGGAQRMDWYYLYRLYLNAYIADQKA